MTTQHFVRIASPCDKSAVEALLRAGFGDEEEFLRAFFAHLYDHCETILSVDEGNIAAMAMLIPCQIVQPGIPQQDALYLYSLTTLPAYRGRGHAQRLLDAAKAKCSRVFLHAADDSLFAMYKSRGWRDMMHVREHEIPAAAHPLPVKRLNGKEYRQLREAHLANAPHVLWDENTLDFLDELLLFGNGGFYEYNGSIATVLNWEDPVRLPIAEALGKDAAALCASLTCLYHHAAAAVLTPCTAYETGAYPYVQGVGESVSDPIQLSFVFL